MKIIGLDVGTKRIGIAKADTSVKIAVPSGVIMVNGQEFSELSRLSRIHDTNVFVIGMPRNSRGEETAQSKYVRNFAKKLASTIPGCRIYFQDESLTSVEAENRLKNKKHQKGDIDSEAAAIILQDCIEHFTTKNTITTPKQNSLNKDFSSDDIDHLDSNEISKNHESTPVKTITPIKTTQSSKPKLTPDANGLTEDILLELEENSEQTLKTDKNHISNEDIINQEPLMPKLSKKRSPLKFILILLALLVITGAAAFYYYQDSLKAPINDLNCNNSKERDCKPIDFKVSTGDSLGQISKNLEQLGLIKNPLTFEIYVRITGNASKIRAGEYQLNKSMSSADILEKLMKGSSVNNVFRFTILPGETIAKIKQKLLDLNYQEEEINEAFSKDYSSEPELSDLLSYKPKEVSLEGYLYGETYEFYKTDSVETIVKKSLKETAKAIQGNNLKELYQQQNLNIHQALTLASIVQKEAKAPDFPGVAQVFLSRIKLGWSLGSDVTASYAVDLVDPKRETYTTNEQILSIDSPYNTRKYPGLPPSPIASPSLLAMKSIASPTSDEYLYFLTGDDGVMYYSKTESEHNQNITSHCQVLCNNKL